MVGGGLKEREREHSKEQVKEVICPHFSSRKGQNHRPIFVFMQAAKPLR